MINDSYVMYTLHRLRKESSFLWMDPRSRRLIGTKESPTMPIPMKTASESYRMKLADGMMKSVTKKGALSSAKNLPQVGGIDGDKYA